MGILTGLTDKPLERICPEFRALPGTNRCQHYPGNGACGLPGAILCVEWLRSNPSQAEPGTLERMLALVKSCSTSEQLPAPAAAPPAPPAAREPGPWSPEFRLQPTPAERPEPPPRASQATQPAARKLDIAVSDVEWRGPSDADVDRLAALGYEITIDTLAGDVTLVPKYTGRDRVELTFTDCRTLAAIVSVFPGTRLKKLTAAAWSPGGHIRMDDRFPRTPAGTINNCALANGAPEAECQICRGQCPDRARFGK